MAHVLIAYHQGAVEQAYALQAALETSGYGTWINPDPQAGDNWLPWVQIGLEDAWGVLTLLNGEAVASPYVTYEWAFALGAGRPVLPVIIAPCAVHPVLVDFDPVDLAAGGVGAVLARLNALARPHCETLLSGVLDSGAATALTGAIEALCAPQSDARQASIMALAGSSDPLAGQALVGALAHPIYRDVRLWTVGALRGRTSPDVIAGLVDTLGDPDLAVAQAASEALAGLGAAAILALRGALGHDRRDVRRAAVLALAQIDDPAAVPALIEALFVRDWHVSRSAAVALGQRGDPRAIPALAGTLRSDDPHLAAESERALLQIGTTEALKLLAQR